MTQAEKEVAGYVGKLVGGIVLAGLVAGGAWWLSGGNGKPQDTPRQAVSKMQFPKGVDRIVGDENGRACHQVWFTSDNGKTFRKYPRRFIDGVDFRTATADQKAAAIKAQALDDVEGSDLAMCAPSDEWFLGASPAYAQPTCQDCGGGCGAYGCPADLVVPYPNCFLGGPDCVVTVVCCGQCNFACE